ncbi:outer membrane lipoprotein-sorting protein [Methanofollis sp. W23]|uniref:outer membrane lipoprotein-sorting protein n=1 Tax=Methanofollis sp. W23 TaxID=2817849 RepID=UPI001AE81EB0|nr:hypothetical protein [Methanofollis sp. W23]MBP2145921.1 outer membrane lipoprotein-sorting protein [Methanofollis sp. W23]
MDLENYRKPQERKTLALTRAALIGLIVAAVLAAGCSVPSAGEVQAAVAEVHEKTTGLSAHVILAAPDWDTMVRISSEDRDRYRFEYLEGMYAGTLVVNDGERLWVYDPAAGNASVIPAEYAGTLFSDAVRQAQTGWEVYQMAVAAVVDGPISSVTAGERDGRQVYEVVVEGDGPVGTAPTGRREEVYGIRAVVDAGTWTVVEAALLDAGGEEVIVAHYAEVSLDPAFPEDAFTFEPPPGTNVTLARTFALTPIFAGNLDDLEKFAGPGTPVPSWLPGGYAFVEGHQIPALSTTVIYARDDAPDQIRLTVRPADLPVPPVPEGVEEVGIDGMDGRYFTRDGAATLVWSDGIMTYELDGPDQREVLIRVAASVGPLEEVV